MAMLLTLKADNIFYSSSLSGMFNLVIVYYVYKFDHPILFNKLIAGRS